MVKIPHSHIEVCQNLIRNSENGYEVLFVPFVKGMKDIRIYDNINSLRYKFLIKM